NAQQLPGRKHSDKRDNSPETSARQQTADALGRKAPSHAGGPGHDPKAQNDERHEEQSVLALRRHEQTEPTASAALTVDSFDTRRRIVALGDALRGGQTSPAG